jgi:hypothetical protein
MHPKPKTMKTKAYLSLLFFILITQFVFSQTKIAIDGVWKDDNSGVKNAVAIFSEQEDNQIVFAHYLEWKGQKFVESGVGIRDGNTITYTVKVTVPIEGWATEGIHILTISEDGKSLKGTYSDNKNRHGEIAFVKVN